VEPGFAFLLTNWVAASGMHVTLSYALFSDSLVYSLAIARCYLRIKIACKREWHRDDALSLTPEVPTGAQRHHVRTPALGTHLTCSTCRNSIDRSHGMMGLFCLFVAASYCATFCCCRLNRSTKQTVKYGEGEWLFFRCIMDNEVYKWLDNDKDVFGFREMSCTSVRCSVLPCLRGCSASSVHIRSFMCSVQGYCYPGMWHRCPCDTSLGQRWTAPEGVALCRYMMGEGSVLSVPAHSQRK
jgi:hypothetical protein